MARSISVNVFSAGSSFAGSEPATGGVLGAVDRPLAESGARAVVAPVGCAAAGVRIAKNVLTAPSATPTKAATAIHAHGKARRGPSTLAGIVGALVARAASRTPS